MKIDLKGKEMNIEFDNTNIIDEDITPNNFSVQIYDGETDNKLDIIYINNIINLNNNNEDFTRIFEEELLDESLKDEGYNINDIYYSIL
jgi:hypothetical protein